MEQESACIPSDETKIVLKANESKDPFDDAEFNTVDFVNRIFPNEQKLSGLDPLIQNLKQRIRRVDAEILDAVRHQSSSGNRAKQDLDQAKRAIQDLFTRIRDIQGKAEQSELMVQEICRDIKKLDCAKKNLTGTITALRRLAMLVAAVDQLESMSSKRMYREAANMLEAVNQLSTHFDSFKYVPKISEMRGKIDTIKLMLKSNIFKEFDSLSHLDPDKDNSQVTSQLAESCLVVDVLETHIREELLADICSKEMTAYKQVFSTSGESARLDRTSARYTWFKKQLRTKQEIWDLFPAAWRVPKMICMYFCKITRAQISEILDDQLQVETGEASVRTLLEALHKTLEFEQELEERFGGSEGLQIEEEHSAGNVEEEEFEDGSAAAVRSKYERARQAKADAENGEGETAAVVPAPPELDGAVAAAARIIFKGNISSCFEPHLKAYVDLEERQLLEHLEKIIQEETWDVDDNTEAKVLGSAAALFLNIKKVFKRCSQLTRRETLFNLYKVFQKILKMYSNKLIVRLPIVTAGVKISDKDERIVCLVINTAEYCKETVSPLGETIAKVLDKPFSEGIDMTSEEDEFAMAITKALGLLVQSMEGRLDTELQNMVRTKWDTVEAVGDQSEYVSTCNALLSHSIPIIGSLISANNFHFFFDKLVVSFAPRVYQSILKCRRFSQAGAQQLLLDTIAIKTLLLDIPTLGSSQPAPASYTKQVNRLMGKAEALLKVILSPVDGLCDTFRALLPESAPADFKTVLDLKGLKKADSQALIEEWGRRSGAVPGAAPRTAMLGKITSSMGGASMTAVGSSMSSMGSSMMNSMSSQMPSMSISRNSSGQDSMGGLRSKLRFGGMMSTGAGGNSDKGNVEAKAAETKSTGEGVKGSAADKARNLFSWRNKDKDAGAGK
ncbi:HIT domain protein [Cymbomonas tetramitiformis]|uniref:HIT domain protein n=1 Tax=Cymbomonas tetramitiformis TaxID=36881 RepID=A0AAE0FM29_9CHLO|nr:HIT domain protein [Cymbomonas tetramitiformis]